MKIITIIALTLGLVWSAVAAEESKGVFGTAFLELDQDDKVELVRTMNETFSKKKQEKDETEAQRQKRIKTIYALNRDAVKAAKDADKKSVIAEVFATAPIEALPTIVDGFATELFTRKMAGLNEKDDSFVEFAAATLLKVNARLRQLPTSRRPGMRSVFAVIAFLKASEGKPEDLRQSLLFYVLTGSEKLARTEWIPEAMGDDGKKPSYEKMLSAGLEGEEPAHADLHPMKTTELGNLLVGSDLRGKNARDVSGPVDRNTERADFGSGEDTSINTVPRGDVNNPDSPWYRRRRGDDTPDPEPENYLGHTL